MFKTGVETELRRRVDTLTSRVGAATATTPGGADTRMSRASVSSDWPSSFAPIAEVTTAAVGAGERKDKVAPLLQGKLKTESQTDLLKLENASIALLTAQLEQENRQLDLLIQALDSNPESLDTTLSAGHDALREIHNRLVEERQTGAVDIVEFVFRSLNARPPPRSRTESAAPLTRPSPSSPSTRTQGASSVSVSRFDRPHGVSLTEITTIRGPGSPHPEIPNAGEMIDVPVHELTPGSPASVTFDFAPPRPRERSMSKIVSTNNNAPPTLNRPPSLMSALGAGAASLLTWSVHKVNRFRRNTPHYLQIDTRLNSLSILTFTKEVKVELNQDQLEGVHAVEATLVAIVYMFQGQEITKKYKFHSPEQRDDFVEKCTNLLHNNGAARRPSHNVAENHAASQPITKYSPAPLDTRQTDLPDELVDVVDSIAFNLSRLWIAGEQKTTYKVDKMKHEVSPKYRLRAQLKMFMGQQNRFHAVSYHVAERLVKDILTLGYKLEQGKVKGKTATPAHRKLIEMLAIDSNEIWCELCIRAHERRVRKALKAAADAEYIPTGLYRPSSTSRATSGPPLATLSETTRESSFSSLPERGNSDVDVLPAERVSSAPSNVSFPSSSPTSLSPRSQLPQYNMSLSPRNRDSRRSIPSRAPSEYERKERTERAKSASQLIPSSGVDGDDPTLGLMHFAMLPPAMQAAHMADASEVLRTLIEYDFVPNREKPPKRFKKPVPPPNPMGSPPPRPPRPNATLLPLSPSASGVDVAAGPTGGGGTHSRAPTQDLSLDTDTAHNRQATMDSTISSYHYSTSESETYGAEQSVAHAGAALRGESMHSRTESEGAGLPALPPVATITTAPAGATPLLPSPPASSSTSAPGVPPPPPPPRPRQSVVHRLMDGKLQ